MPCYHPIAAYQVEPGKPLFFGKTSFPRGSRRIEVPCGQCIGCMLERCRQWAVRCMHEAKMHDFNCFVTLTYDDEHLPADGSLCHDHFVAFFKRLRERLRADDQPLIRFFMGGEYGETFGRPHYHSLIFGFYPTDRKHYKVTDAGFNIYTSEFLDSVWRFGRVYIGDVTFESASYVARYCLSKTKDDSPKLQIFNVVTGEIYERKHEYGKMSNRPGIGAGYVAKYGRDLFMHDRVVSRGREAPLPRYYDILLERISPLLLAEHKAVRRERSDMKFERLREERPDLLWRDPRRLDVEEVVKKASINFLKRGD